MTEQIFIMLVFITGFCSLVCIGGLIAWACGCKVNEPEYYARKERLRKERMFK